MILRRAEAAHDAVTRAGFALAQLCLVVIVGAYAFETVSRYFFGAPTWWSNEVVAYALCIGTFLALPEVSRQNGHIAISFVIGTLPPRAAGIAGAVLALVAGLTCLVVAWISFEANLAQIARGEMLVRVKPIPKVWIAGWITYGFLGSGLHFLRLAPRRPLPGSGPVAS